MNSLEKPHSAFVPSQSEHAVDSDRLAADIEVEERAATTAHLVSAGSIDADALEIKKKVLILSSLIRDCTPALLKSNEVQFRENEAEADQIVRDIGILTTSIRAHMDIEYPAGPGWFKRMIIWFASLVFTESGNLRRAFERTKHTRANLLELVEAFESTARSLRAQIETVALSIFRYRSQEILATDDEYQKRKEQIDRLDTDLNWIRKLSTKD